MILRFIFGIIFGMVMRFVVGMAIVFVGVYYLLFHSFPFAKLPGRIWDNIISSKVQVSVEQDGNQANLELSGDQAQKLIDQAAPEIKKLKDQYAQ